VSDREIVYEDGPAEVAELASADPGARSRPTRGRADYSSRKNGQMSTVEQSQGPVSIVTETSGSAKAAWWRWGYLGWLCLALMTLASVFSLWLRQRLPFTPAGSVYDDVLFVRGASALLHGQWLGPFDQLTLAKGPAYPVFIAVTNRLNIPLSIGEQLTYLLACAALTACVLVISRRVIVACAVYVVLALDPVNYALYNAGITRDGWYSSLSVLLLAATFLAVFGAVTRANLAWVLPVSALAGITGAAFWLCREEGPWILPAMFVAIGGPPICLAVRAWARRARHPMPARRHWLARLGRLGLVLAVLSLAAVSPIEVVIHENSQHYGAALTNDLTTGDFARAFADWTRVQAGPRIPDVPITRAQMAAVYRISPAARELEPTLEDPKSVWARYSCWGAPRCELSGAFTVWAVRGATPPADFKSGSAEQAFFAALDKQIVSACTTGQLHCDRSLPPTLQSIAHLDTGRLGAAFQRSSRDVLASRMFYDPPKSVGPLPPWFQPMYSETVHGLPASQPASDAQTLRFTAVQWQYTAMGKTYRTLIPVLLGLALVGLLWSILRPRWSRFALTVFVGALLVAALSRLLFVALLNSTEFDSTDMRYQLPTHALLLAIGVIGTAQFVDILWTWRTERMSRVPWNFGGGPRIIRLRSRSHHDGRHRHSARRHAAAGRLAGLAGAGGR
jgi:hypothetical protein